MAGSNEALADAFSGVVGTLVSLWCFYPIERIKTNLQAGKSLSSSVSSVSLSSSPAASVSRKRQQQSNNNNNNNKVWIRAAIKQSFKGCWTKSLHATSSSFCYFYFYSWVLSVHNNKHNKTTGQKTVLPPSTRLVLSAIAAMMNTFVTLPLDVLSSKKTVENDDDDDEKNNEQNERNASEPAENIETIEHENNDNDNNNNRLITEKAWGSVDAKKQECATATTTSTTRQEMTVSTSSSSSSSPPSSSSASSSSTIEMVFHETCSRSEDLFHLHVASNDENEEHEDHEEHENDNNTSRCSSNSSTLSQNDEYKSRWKERLEQRKTRRKNKQYQQQNDDNDAGILGIPKNPICSSRTNGATIVKPSIVAVFGRYAKLWKGLAPALLLCTNPSIHYTVFDVLKTKLLAWKKRSTTTRGRRPSAHADEKNHLSVSEAFVLGLLSKFVATIATYPLIRAKVLMMVATTEPNAANNTGSTTTAAATTTTFSSSPTLWSVLVESYNRDGGVRGLYKGCDWQLVHTLLKSALMMTIREQITDTSRALFGVGVVPPTISKA